MKNQKDINVIRELSKIVAEISAKEIQEERRELWSRHNNLEHVPVPIYIRGGGWSSELIVPMLQCEDKFYREHELFLRNMIFQDTIGDDYVIEPWITQKASYILPVAGSWGLKVNYEHSGVEGGAFHVEPPMKDLDDVKNMITPAHKIDEVKTAENVEKLKEAVGDSLEVNIDRAPFWRMWSGDISTDLGYLRGIEQIMWDMMDEPEKLHKLVAFMSEGILKAHNEAEEAGDWQLSNHENQSMAYVKGLKNPKANSGSVKRSDLWGYMAAQELTLISPQQHDEFLLQYQLPILKKFGMVAYGCCEDLTRKIDMLRKIPNLRRIAVTPFSNVASCAEQIGSSYVSSWRPSPSATVCLGFDPANVKKIICDGMKEFRSNNCIVDICLKDVHTVQRDPERLANFVKIVRSVVE